MNCFYYLVQYSTKRRKERGGEKKKDICAVVPFFIFWDFISKCHVHPTPPHWPQSPTQIQAFK